mgnify:CR=1 FL=1
MIEIAGVGIAVAGPAAAGSLRAGIAGADSRICFAAGPAGVVFQVVKGELFLRAIAERAALLPVHAFPVPVVVARAPESASAAAEAID